MIKGKIIKGIGGFYYIHDGIGTVYECRAKGKFRNQKLKPLVGDDVEMDIIDTEKRTGNVSRILPRQNDLIRPAVANVDQALLVFSVTSPEPNFNLMDRFLIMMEQQGLPVILCFNKTDLATEEEINKCLDIYRHAGYPVEQISVAKEEGLERIRDLLRGKTTVLAGPSGVGKSSLMNYLNPSASMETGEISQKIQRGKHTTRHSELFYLEPGTFLMDTPGFTSLSVFTTEEREIRDWYPEFRNHMDGCRFLDCVHVGEKDCGVKEAVNSGEISQIRYENYLQIYQEVKNTRKY